jgi:hypothetical protein
VDLTGLSPTKFTSGIRASLVLGFNIETGFTSVDSNGAYATVFTIGGGVYWNYTVLTIYLPDGTVVTYDGKKIKVQKDPGNKYVTDKYNRIEADDPSEAYQIIIGGNRPKPYYDNHTAEECAEYYAPI